MLIQAVMSKTPESAGGAAVKTSGKDKDGRVRVGETTVRHEESMSDCFIDKLAEGGRDVMLPAASHLLRDGVLMEPFL